MKEKQWIKVCQTKDVELDLGLGFLHEGQQYALFFVSFKKSGSPAKTCAPINNKWSSAVALRGMQAANPKLPARYIKKASRLKAENALTMRTFQSTPIPFG